MNKECFGSFIKELRQNKNYTQQKLADLLYLDVSAVSKWERGVSYPDITMIPKICEVLDIDEHELIKCSRDLEYQRIKEEGLKFISIKNKTFWTMTILYIIAIATCFIVNICVNKTLSWFFIVLSSCITGFMFFPTVTRFLKKDKFFWYVISTFISLTLLYLTCSICTNNYWWLIATFGTLLGYYLIFYPIIYNKKILYINENYENNKKYFWISYSIGLLLLTLLLIVFINIYIPINLSAALYITLYSYSLLIVISLIRLININKYIRIGIDFLLSIIFLFGLDKVLTHLLGQPDEFGYRINFNDWNHYTNGNVVCIIMIILFICSIIFFIVGLCRRNNKKDNK